MQNTMNCTFMMEYPARRTFLQKIEAFLRALFELKGETKFGLTPALEARMYL